MNDSEIWRKVLALYGSAMARTLRELGIEMTPDEIEQMVRDAILEATRESLKKMFLRMMEKEQ